MYTFSSRVHESFSVGLGDEENHGKIITTLPDGFKAVCVLF